MKTIKIITLTVAGITTCIMLQPAQAVVPLARGWYAEGNIGFTNTKNTDKDGHSSSDKAPGFNVDLGYKFMPFFGAEFGYTTYGSSASSFTGSYAYDVAAKGILPFQEVGIEAFAKLGAAYVKAKDNHTGDSAKNSTDVYYGLGASYYFTPNMSFLLQWAQAKGGSSTGNLDLFSIGVNYLI